MTDRELDYEIHQAQLRVLDQHIAMNDNKIRLWKLAKAGAGIAFAIALILVAMNLYFQTIQQPLG